MSKRLPIVTEESSNEGLEPPQPRSVLDLARYNAFPLAARHRELKKAVSSFASCGRNMFVHHVEHMLTFRRTLLTSSATTKKRYPKTAAQLWPGVDQEQAFFWNEAAAQLRRALKTGVVSLEHCIMHHGLEQEYGNYRWWAELGVATYLQLPLPVKREVAPLSNTYDEVKRREAWTPTEETNIDQPLQSAIGSPSTKVLKVEATATKSMDVAAKSADVNDPDSRDFQLLYTVPDVFTVEPRTIYSHFAHYDLNAVRKAVGKHQVAMLRQLADLLHRSGKTLFYYYAYPHICKRTNPPTAGETAASEAADIWMFLDGGMRSEWIVESERVKKKLGDGDVLGLISLELESADPAVLKLHSLADAAIEAHRVRKHAGKM